MAAKISRGLVEEYEAKMNPNATAGPSSVPQRFSNAGYDPTTQATSNPWGENLSEDSAAKINQLQFKLKQKLGPEYISTRPGGGGIKVAYIEGWKLIELANDVFGFNGWNSTVCSMTVDYVDQDEQTKRFSIGVSAIVRITLRDGVFHEDLGYGHATNIKAKGEGLDKCKKEAVTDGLKRAFKSFGNLMGNCLYENAYTKEVMKIKVPPAKFNPSNMHRRPEFADPPSPTETKHNIASISSNATTSASSHNNATASSSRPHAQPTNNNTSRQPAPTTIVKTEPKPISAAPSHLNTGNPTTSTPDMKVQPTSALKSGLQTPLTTPANPQVSYRQPPPQPQQQRVHFAQLMPPPGQMKPVDKEDSFDMGSDDEAFFAGVDLDSLESNTRLHALSPSESSDLSMQGGFSNQQAGSSSTSAIQPQQRRYQHEAQNTNMSTVPTYKTPQQSRPQQFAAENRPPGQQNGRPQQFHSLPTPPMNDKSSISSMGGFHFPPGAQNPNVQTLKRPAEAMQSHSVPRRPFHQGMGLAAQQGSTAMVQGREVLGRLDIGEGGDVKRMRR